MVSTLSWFLNTVLGDVFVLMCVMFLFVGLIEFFFPAQKIPRAHYAFNLGYAFVTVFVVSAITPFLSVGVAYAIQYIGFGLIDLRTLGFEGFGGALFAVLIGTLIVDFFQYWQHRLEHSSKILWQMHLLHHCDEHMNVTTAARHHVFENFLAPVLITIPTAILFKVPPVTIAMLSLVPYAWLYLSHANINLGFGPFWWLLVSPNYHRVHHSLMPEHIDKNFANWFPILDICFGTVCVPRWLKSPSTGVAGVSVRTLSGAYLQPIKAWLGMLANPAHKGASGRPPEGTLPGGG